MKFTLRIKKNKVFKYVLNRGKYKVGKYISIHVTNLKKDVNYLGICISKKNGNSVQRNKMKRWIREIYKNQENLLKKGKSIVILYKKNTTFSDVNYNILNNEVIACFKDLEIYE